MIQLTTLGHVGLDVSTKPESRTVASQPKRLAILIYLAVARPRGPHRRDELLALFWPEFDGDRARQVLRQSLYRLRQALGKDVLRSQGDEDVEVDTSQLECDVVRFEGAIMEGRLTDALDSYGGDFLHAFHAPEVAPEFEEWIAEERNRLRAMASSAAWQLAAREERDGDSAGALYWARRSIALNPDNEDAIRDLAQLHARLGDRVGAAQVLAEHARRLKRDYEMEPGVELTRLGASLRTPPVSPPTPAGPDPSLSTSPAMAGTEGVAVAPPLPPTSPAPTERRWRRWSVAAVVLGLVSGAVALAGRYGRGTPPGPPLLAIGPIIELSGADSSAESVVASDLIATSLARLNGIAVIPGVRLYEIQGQLRAVGAPASLLTAARQAGAAQILRGTLHRRPDGRLGLDGQVIDLATGSVSYAFRAEGSDLFDLVDRATEVLAAQFGAEAPPVPIQDVTTRSLVAYRLYQEGLRAYYMGDLRLAYPLFRSAIAQDTSFAMATYYAGLSAAKLQLPGDSSLLFLAGRLAEHAPDRERLLIRYRVAQTHEGPGAAALAETLSVRYPNDPDAIFVRGMVLMWRGRWNEAGAEFRRVIELDSLSLRAQTVRCLACEAFDELWWRYVYGDSMQRAEAVAREWMRRHGRIPATIDRLAVALERQGRLDEAFAVWSILWDSVPPEQGVASFKRATLALRSGDLAAAHDSFAEFRRKGTPAQRGEAAWYLAITMRNEGRPREAVALGEGLVALALFESGAFREAAALFDNNARTIARAPPLQMRRQLPWNLVHVATALAAAGDTARLPALADSVEQIGGQSHFGRDPLMHHYVRGLLYLVRGDRSQAAEAFRRSIWSWTDGYTRANYELAKVSIALGRPQDAVHPLQAALRGDLQSSNLYVTRTELHELLGRAFEAVGQGDSAAAHYRQVASAWQRAEPAFTARREHAVAFLAAR